MRVKFGNSIKDVPLLEVTKENYIVPRGEEDTYHCRIEQTQFNPRNGKRQSRPRIQKFDAKMFPMLRRNLAQQGWDVEILYDPTEFLKERDEKRQAMQEMTYMQRKEAEEKRKAAEREQIKKELLEELKEMGLLKAPAKEQKATEKPKTAGSK